MVQFEPKIHFHSTLLPFSTVLTSLPPLLTVTRLTSKTLLASVFCIPLFQENYSITTITKHINNNNNNNRRKENKRKTNNNESNNKDDAKEERK